jgi:AAA family ATP:ADP antiporter
LLRPLTLRPPWQVLDGMRKAIHYALCKPTKEGLYAAMPQDVVFVAKPLLDTLVYRAGSLVCAAWFEAAIAWGLTSRVRQYSLLAVAALWVANSFWVGLLAEREQEAREGAKAKANGRAAML